MANYVKDGNKVVVLLAPSENDSAAQNLVGEIKKVSGSTGETLVVNSAKLHSRK